MQIAVKPPAEGLGLSKNDIRMIINSKRQPRFKELWQIADYLIVKIWELIAGLEESVTAVLEYKGRVNRSCPKLDLRNLLQEMEDK